MTSLRHEITVAIRSLRRSRLTTVAIVLTLAICIGATAAVYAVVDVVLMRALPLDKPERVLWVSSVSRDRPDRPFSLPEFMDYRAQAKTIRLAAYTSWNAILESPSGATRLQGIRVSGEALEVLGATPALGRNLKPEDDEPGAPHVVMVGYGYWQRALGGDPRAVARELILDGDRVHIVGVLPKFFPIPVRDVDVVAPLNPLADPRRAIRSSVNFLRVVGRLRDNANEEGASQELNAIASRLRNEFPTEYASKIGARTLTLQEYMASTQRPTLIILLSCVVLMFGIALVNVASLLLSRAVARQGETAVRLALGASLQRISTQLLVEGALLVGASAGIGLLAAEGLIRLAAVRLSAISPRIEEAHLSGGSVIVMIALCAVAVAALSVVPAIIARKTSPQLALRGLGRSVASSSAQVRLRSAFVVAEIALAVVVTAATAALAQSLFRVQRLDLGFKPDSVFVARLSLPSATYRNPADLARFASGMRVALSRVPGVTAVGGVSVAPLSGVLRSVPFAPANSALSTQRDWPAATYRAVSPGYLAAIGARQMGGRTIEDRDDATAPTVAVINRTLAYKYFGNSSPIGRQVLVNDGNAGSRALSVVGVVDDIREADLGETVGPEIIVAMDQINAENVPLLTATQFWAIRFRGDARAFGPVFSRVLHGVDPIVAEAGSTSLRDYVDAAIAPRRFSVGLMTGFAAVGLLLTILGVYGVTSYTVEQRRREIGVRVALGATPRSIVTLVIWRSLGLALCGIAVGVTIAVLARSLLATQLFGVAPNDVSLFMAVGGWVMITVAAASSIPSVRASRIDPLIAMASE